jgi:internalin A
MNDELQQQYSALVQIIQENIRTKETVLFLKGQGVNILPFEIGELKHLQSLDLRGNWLSSIPFTIGSLVLLTGLDLGFNRIASLPSQIEKLKNLEQLYLNGNRISVLPQEICSLTNLRILDLSHNSISELPDEIINLVNLEMLDLRENPLPIPLEILEKINEPQAILNYYFSLHREGERPLNEIKIIVVGQGAAGKTSVIRRVINNNFDANESKTEGISINRWQITNQSKNKDQQKISLNIWDFGGQEIMHATHQFFLTKRSLYLLVLDSRLTQEENRVEYWLKIIQSFSDESPVLIIGNKIDQHPLDIDRTGLQKKYPNIVGILETSAATGAGIEELKAAITEQVNNLPHVRDLLPETWFTVKTKLEGLGRESNFITHDKYLDLCAENEVSDETSQRTLIGFLHDLGVVLHFQDDSRLEALGILNPQWVTNGVYKILNSHTLFQNKGMLTISMLDEILNLPEYPRGKRLFIVDMMKKFELCYDIEPDKTFLVPDLLPKDQPDLKFNGVPAFEYAYPVLPSSVITRFIVRMNQKIDDGFVWRTGVVLKIGENKVLVKADIEDRKITIAIDGIEHTRRDALSAIRYQLDEIHASIKGLDAQKRVPIPEAPNAEPLDYDYLLQLERDGELEILPVKEGSRLVKVNVRKLLSGVVSETERRQSAGNTTNIYIGGDVSGNVIAGDENEVKK